MPGSALGLSAALCFSSSLVWRKAFCQRLEVPQRQDVIIDQFQRVGFDHLEKLVIGQLFDFFALDCVKSSQNSRLGVRAGVGCSNFFQQVEFDQLLEKCVVADGSVGSPSII